MAHQLTQCKRCGKTAVFYRSINKVSCAYCSNGKLDLNVQATVPPGKIKVSAPKLTDSTKAPLFAGLEKESDQAELF